MFVFECCKWLISGVNLIGPRAAQMSVRMFLEEISIWTGGICKGDSVQFSCSVVSDSLQPLDSSTPGSAVPSLTLGACSNSCSSSRWCHPVISSSVVPFSCFQSFPPLGSFLTSQFFASGGQSTGVSASASVPTMNIQDWFPLGWTGLIKCD